MKLNKITSDHPKFQEILEDYLEEIDVEPRRGSNYFCRKVYEVNEKFFPDNPEIHGFWITETHIDDHEYSMSDCGTVIKELTRVEPREKTITVKEWVEVGV